MQSLADYDIRYYPYIEEYLKEFQDTRGSLNGEQEYLKKKTGKLIERQIRKMKRIDGELQETGKMDIYKLYGDLLMIYAYEKHDHKKSVTVKNLLSEKQENTSKILLKINLLTCSESQIQSLKEAAYQYLKNHQINPDNYDINLSSC